MDAFPGAFHPNYQEFKLLFEFETNTEGIKQQNTVDVPEDTLNIISVFYIYLE